MNDQTQEEEKTGNVLAFNREVKTTKKPTIEGREKVIESITKSIKVCHPRCLAITVDEHTRTVSCRVCGKVHDPLDWLIGIAKWEKDVFQHTESLRDALRATEQRVAEAERAERNVKARLRAMRNKLETTRQELAESVSAVEAKAYMRDETDF